jgi:hypothetical protein
MHHAPPQSPPCSPTPRQLPLPFQREPIPPPQPPDLVTLPLSQIWPSLTPALRVHVRLTLLHVLQEAIDDANCVTTSELP